VKFGLNFRHHSSLSRPYFETKKHIDTKVSRWILWYRYLSLFVTIGVNPLVSTDTPVFGRVVSTYMWIPPECLTTWALIRPPDVSRESLMFYPWTFFFSLFINPSRSAATQWSAIKCILEFGRR